MLNKYSKYELLKSLEKDSSLTQRQLSKELGLSLGKVNYCLRNLIDKGFIKVHRFKVNKNKAQYLYLLTPEGVKKHAKLTMEFLKEKTIEYEALKKEVERLGVNNQNS